MKVAVIKLGARIAYGSRDTSGGNGEAKAIINMLYTGGADVHIYTKILKKDIIPDHLTIWNIEDEYKNINDRGYDSLIIINGFVNFFGGAEARDQILNYHLINNFDKKVYYIYCDPALTLRQIWGSIEKKEWSDKYDEVDIKITRDDITYISQPYNLDSVKELLQKTDDVNIKDVEYYPLEMFNCMDKKLEMVEEPSYDLLYGGTMRSNRRIDKMIKFYFGYPDDINVEMFGKIKIDDLVKRAEKKHETGLRNPSIGKAVNYSEYSKKVNDTLAHVVIGDKWYEGNDMPQRCYQSIWASTITFIDIELDPEKRVLGKSDVCSRFNYVKDRNEVIERLNKIKSNPYMRTAIIKEQFDAIEFDTNEYCGNFVNLLKNKL